MNILSVSQYNYLIKEYLENEIGELAIEGEVSEFRVYKGNLVYFRLKDKEAQMLCFMMLFEVKTPIEDGMHIRVLGFPSVFTKRGELHFRVQAIELLGEGALAKALEMTKKKLETEGIFRPERKRVLPRFPERVGLITSREAAAYTDVLRVLNNRWGGMEILFYPVAVQGLGAVGSIVKALEYFSREKNADVVIVTRGGGSLEDLQAFNSEEVARAIFACRVPVVCGVGHERDESLADYAADVRASTPSNAAERVAPSREEVRGEIGHLVNGIGRSFMHTLETRFGRLRHAVLGIGGFFEKKKERFVYAGERFARVSGTLLLRIKKKREKIGEYTRSFEEAMRGSLRLFSERVRARERMMQGQNPTRLLKRGWSIVRNETGKIIRSVKDVSLGDMTKVQLGRGTLETEIIKKYDR